MAASIPMVTRTNIIAPPIFTTKSSMPPRTLPSVVATSMQSNAPPKNYSTIVRTTLQGIKRVSNDPLSSLAKVMCLMSESIQATVTNISTLLHDVAASKLEQTAIERRVTKLGSTKKEALNLSAAAYTRAKNVQPYTLVVLDVPPYPDILTPDFIVHIGGMLNVTFSTDCITDFWRAPRSRLLALRT